MKVYVSQIYIEPGIEFPFSHIFQRHVHKRLSELVDGWGGSSSKYDSDFKLVFNMSSKSNLQQNEIRGPTVFKKNKSVEYTIFIPFCIIGNRSLEDFLLVLQYLFEGIILIMKNIGINTDKIEAQKDDIIMTILNDGDMFE